jgi:hypothetical protein
MVGSNSVSTSHTFLFWFGEGMHALTELFFRRLFHEFIV